MVMPLEDEVVAHILEFYHRPVFRDATDYDYAVTTETEVTSNGNTYYQYTVPGQIIYIDETGYAVTYGEQKVEDEKVYYKRDSDDFFEYISKYEWARTESEVE